MACSRGCCAPVLRALHRGERLQGSGSQTNATARTVVVADEHAVFVLGMVSSLRMLPQVAVTGQTTRRAVLLELVEQQQPDMVITGYTRQVEGGTPPSRAPIADIGRLSPSTRIIVITSQPSDALHRRILRAGAHLVQDKTCPINTLIRGVIDTLKGGAATAGGNQRPVIVGTSALSACEQQVLRLYLSGMNVTAIATRLQRSKKTISAQKISAMKKLGVSSNQELVLLATSFPLPEWPEGGGF